MTLLASATVASAGVYAYCAVHYGALWSMRRQAAEHGAFATVCAALAGLALGGARVETATDVADAAIGQRWGYAFAIASTGALIVFCSRVSGRPWRALERIGIGCSAVFACAAAAGLFVDPSVASAAYDGAARLAGGRPTAALLFPARLGFGACIALSIAALSHLGREAKRDRALRATFAAACVPLAAGIWDVSVRWLGLPLPIVSSLMPVLAVAAISWALVGRFARVDAELASRTEELATSYETLRHAQQELVRTEQLAAVGELSAVIAHEVRNPLAIIRNAVSGLRRVELQPDDAETLLGILDEEADRLNRLVQDLLTYAKPVTPDPRTVHVGELVRRAVELAREGQRRNTDIEFSVECPVDISVVEGDPALLRHALINIVDNAMQAMPDGGTIAVRCRLAELDGRAAVAIEFRDEGEGMDTLVRSKARDPFFTTRSSGTGLGLAIVDRVARVHGGGVEIESRHGQGTTVTLLLPRERVSTAPPASFS